MISLQKRFLFIHVPKTGGNSVQDRLKTYSEDRIVRVGAHQDGVERFEVRSDRYPVVKHSTLSQYEQMIEPDIYETLFKFSTIRNPWDKLISVYFHPNRGVSDWDREDFKDLISRVEPLRSFIVTPSLRERVGERLGGAKVPLLSKPLDGDVDLIMRFERLDEDFRSVCERLGIPHSPLPRRNRSERRRYSEYYDDELIEAVGERFREEIEYGGYRFETGP